MLTRVICIGKYDLPTCLTTSISGKEVMSTELSPGDCLCQKLSNWSSLDPASLLVDATPTSTTPDLSMSSILLRRRADGAANLHAHTVAATTPLFATGALPKLGFSWSASRSRRAVGMWCVWHFQARNRSCHPNYWTCFVDICSHLPAVRDLMRVGFPSLWRFSRWGRNLDVSTSLSSAFLFQLCCCSQPFVPIDKLSFLGTAKSSGNNELSHAMKWYASEIMEHALFDMMCTTDVLNNYDTHTVSSSSILTEVQ